MPASSYVAGKASSSTTAPAPKPSLSTPEPSRGWLAEKKPRAGSFQVGGSARQKLSILFPSHSASRRLPCAKPDAGLCWHWLRLRAASPRKRCSSALCAGEAFQTRRSQPRNRILPPRRRTRAGDPQRAFRRKMSGNFRAGVERLYELTSELRHEVQKTVTSDVLSIRMCKKTEEIEKLVKQIKSKAKG